MSVAILGRAETSAHKGQRVRVRLRPEADPGRFGSKVVSEFIADEDIKVGDLVGADMNGRTEPGLAVGVIRLVDLREGWRP